MRCARPQWAGCPVAVCHSPMTLIVYAIIILFISGCGMGIVCGSWHLSERLVDRLRSVRADTLIRPNGWNGDLTFIDRYGRAVQMGIRRAVSGSFIWLPARIQFAVSPFLFIFSFSDSIFFFGSIQITLQHLSDLYILFLVSYHFYFY